MPRRKIRTSIRRASRALALTLSLLLGLAFSFGPSSVHAQLFDNPEWKESDVPPPPTFDERRLMAIDMPLYMNLRFAVDPATIALTPDGVVRYVIVASRPGPGGAVNAFYEGIRCATDQVKTYARHTGEAWQMVDKPEWKPFRSLNSRYASALAEQALCRGHAPRESVRDMVRYLQQSNSQ